MKAFALLKWAVVIILLSTTRLYAQSSEYNTIYHIQLVSSEDKIAPNSFDHLHDLGFVRIISTLRGPAEAEGPQRVILGPFLGDETAQYVLNEAIVRGYNDAFIFADDITLQEGKGKELTQTLQIGAFSKLNLNMFKPIANFPAHGMYVVYEDGLFKVFAGMYSQDQLGYLKRTIIPHYRREIGLDCFIRQFRVTEEVQAKGDTIASDYWGQ